MEIREVLGMAEGEILTRCLYAFEEEGPGTGEKVTGQLVCKGELKNVGKMEAAGFTFG